MAPELFLACEGLPIGEGLGGVGAGEGEDGLREFAAAADVSVEGGGVSGAGVGAGKELAAELGVGDEGCALEAGDGDGGLVVVELADEVVA